MLILVSVPDIVAAVSYLYLGMYTNIGLMYVFYHCCDRFIAQSS